MTSVRGDELIIDASAALVFALSGSFEPLADRNLVAPALLWSEAGASLHQRIWRQELGRDEGVEARDLLFGARIEIFSPPLLQRLAWELADQLGWAKTYDAEYVALARLRGRPLLTSDVRLQRRVGGLVEVIGPADL